MAGWLLAWLLTAGTYAQTTQEFIFFTGTQAQIQTRAQNAARPYFIYLYANWSELAKEMNRATFRSPEFVQYAQGKWLGLAVDGESILDEGLEIAGRYQVMYFPAIVAFTPEGREVGRLYGFQSATNLVSFLKKFEKERGAPLTALAAKAADSTTAVQQSKPDEAGGLSEGTLYKISARPLPMEGYGVQIGAYEDYRNAFMKLLEMGHQKFYQNVITYINEKSAKPVYRLIIGPFTTEEQAEAYRQAYMKKEKTKDAVLVNLREIEREGNK